MTLVEILQKLRNDLIAWSTTNFNAVDANFAYLIKIINALGDKINALEAGNAEGVEDLKQDINSNSALIAANSDNILALSELLSTALTNIDELIARTDNINGADDDTLFITDGEGNIIAYFNENGLRVTEIEADKISLKDSISHDGDEFFLIDKDDNVVFYVNAGGIHTTDIHANGDVIADSVQVNQGIKYITDVFYIIDSSNNTKLQINNDGVKVINLTVDNVLNVNKINANEVDADIINLDAINANNFVAKNAEIETATVKNLTIGEFVEQQTDKFFVTDNSGNVAFYIDNQGTHVTDLYTNSNLNVSGNSVLNGIITALGEATFNNKVNVNNTLTVNESINANKLISNNIQSNDLVTNSANIQADLQVNGNATISGNTSMQSLEVVGDFKSANLDATNSEAFYITDMDNNVIAYFNANGLYITDITSKGISYDGEHYYKTNANSANDNRTVNQLFVDVLNQIVDHANRITEVESNLQTVSNVMDFIGVFQTTSELYAYANPNSGDVAVVIENQTEYIYVAEQGWVEFGYSTHVMNSLMALAQSVQDEIEKRELGNSAVNYRGNFTSSAEVSQPEIGDIAVIGQYLQIYNGESWESFSGLSKKLYYINGEASDKIFFTDQDDNVIVYIDGNGLHTTSINARDSIIVDGYINSKSAAIGTIDFQILKTNNIENNADTLMYFQEEGIIDINFL